MRKKYKLPEKYISFLGNTDPKKNVAGVLKALAILKKENRPGIKLLMLDIDREYLSKLASEIGEPGLLDDISFSGYVPNKELPAIYSMAEMFLYPSLRESFGIPMLEAMACGVPVICSNTSSMPEVAGDAAILVDPTNAAEIAASVKKLLSDEGLRSSLVKAGFKRVEKFTWKANAQKTLEIYSELLEN